MITVGNFFFAVMALISLLGAVLTVAARNPIRSAVGLLGTIIGIAGLFLKLNAEFMAAIQLIVYAGAVVVLFVFVVMLLGPVMDSHRAASILKNLHSLHLRIKRHGENAHYVAESLRQQGIDVRYPGLTDAPGYETLHRLMNTGYGYGGMLLLNMGTRRRAYDLMERMQQANVGYLAVSLGFYKTLFSAPGSSTSSEIPDGQRERIGLTDGLVRMSIGLDANIGETVRKMMMCIKAVERTIPLVEAVKPEGSLYAMALQP